ncbi:MAG: LPS export ABC transporter periplasmic protein LptC [Gammaproteobacteria bacterium]|nr:LPS export ABC transporter periplasmic protein LptC [Gammaproteobacteria bacterium]
MNRWLAALALALLAALSFWLAERITTTTAPAPALPRVPDYTLDDMERTLLDDMGQVAQIIRARHVTRYEREDITELVAPSMELYNDEGQPWHVIADEGTVTENGDLIMLTGAVEIWRLDAAGQRELEIRTTGLRVLPDEQFAESATLTTITTPDSVTRSIGMRADLATRRVELLEQVRTRYEKAD